VAQASYRQLFLAPPGVSPVYDGRDSGPLVSVTDDATALIVLTGCAGGPVGVVIDTGIVPPPPESAGWEVCEAVSIAVARPLHLTSPTWTGLIRPVIAATSPGPHRVRVSARGRGANVDLSVLTPSESYLIEVWPEAEMRPRETLRDDGVSL
jgi:hypothetical protein